MKIDFLWRESEVKKQMSSPSALQGPAGMRPFGLEKAPVTVLPRDCCPHAHARIVAFSIKEKHN